MLMEDRLAKNNNEAISKLSEGNYSVAQSIFRKCAKIKPSCRSLNNLGVYYRQFGMILCNGNERTANKIGLRYLLKAYELGSDWRNIASIASALCEENLLHIALPFWEKASSATNKAVFRYNLGVCLFVTGKWEEAIPHFRDVCQETSIKEIEFDGGMNPFLCIAYCYLMMNDISECANCIKRYRLIWQCESLYDVFILRYFCGLYDDALSECKMLLKEWYPSDTLLAMIAYSAQRTHGVSSCNEIIPCEFHEEWINVQKNLDKHINQVQKFSYRPPIISTFCFIE